MFLKMKAPGVIEYVPNQPTALPGGNPINKWRISRTTASTARAQAVGLSGCLASQLHAFTLNFVWTPALGLVSHPVTRTSNSLPVTNTLMYFVATRYTVGRWGYGAKSRTPPRLTSLGKMKSVLLRTCIYSVSLPYTDSIT